LARLRALFWRALPGVRPGERSRFLFFAGLSGTLAAALTLGIAGSEALFLTRVGAEALPRAFVIASLATVGVSLVYAASVGGARNDVFFIRMLVLGALLLAGTTVALSFGVAWAPLVAFCLMVATQAVYQNHFWTFAWDYFDALASKRLFPLFTIGNSAGGFAGGLVAVSVSSIAPAEVLLAAWGALLVAAAVLLRAARRPLRRWGPLELEEGDETSVAGMLGALRYIGRAALARWFVVSLVAMMLALGVAQYLYSDVFARAYPDAATLAIFLGGFLALTNLFEIAVEIAVTPWLIARLGVASANLVHPLLTLASFGGLALAYAVPAAALARVNREPLENAIAEPVRTLAYNAIPLRFRGRLRLFLEGVVRFSGIAVAGGALLLLEDRVTPLALCAVGGGLALLYLLANAAVRRSYLATLVAQLRAGRLDLGELGGELGDFETARLAELWESLLADERLTQPELELAAVLVAHELIDPVLRATKHADPRVRRACVTALGASGDPRAEDAQVVALGDPDPGVRLAAVEVASARAERSSALADALNARVRDPDPSVRAAAAAADGADGELVLREMLGSRAVADVVAALRALPAVSIGLALEREYVDPLARAARLEAAVRAGAVAALAAPVLSRALDHADPRLRRATVRALAVHPDRRTRSALARALADGDREVRVAAADALAAAGDDALPLIVPQLGARAAATVDAAAAALGALGTPRARAALSEALRARVRAGWQAALAARALADADTAAERFLASAYADRVEQNRRAAFAILERMEDARVMRTVDKVLRFASGRVRADALEVLSNLGDREAAALLVLSLEDGPLDDKLGALAAYVRVPADPAEVIAAALHDPDPWLRLGAAGARTPEEVTQMERLLVLRRISLFQNLSLDQLEAINRLLRESRYLSGEIVCREGDLGNELFILIEGEVRFLRNFGTPQELLLNTQQPVSAFGEMGVLADAPRSATVVAATDATLLVLEGERLKELILQVPEISFEIFRVLTARVRAAEERLRA
jgi:HEAT repeat protein